MPAGTTSAFKLASYLQHIWWSAGGREWDCGALGPLPVWWPLLSSGEHFLPFGDMRWPWLP